MTTNISPPECRAMVLFGATGDLAKRMLWPSLYALDRDGLLPKKFQLIGAATSTLSDDLFIARVKEAIQVSANAKLFDDAAFATFAARIRYVAVNVQAPGGLAPIKCVLQPGGPDDGGVMYYLSTGPQLFGPICLALRDAGLVDKLSRIIVEKPIGTDTANQRNADSIRHEIRKRSRRNTNSKVSEAAVLRQSYARPSSLTAWAVIARPLRLDDAANQCAA